MNIIHCIYSLNTGGAETMLIDIINKQCKSNQITLIIINNSYQNYLLDKINKKINIIFLNRKESSHSLIPFIKLNYILFRLQADVIHLHQSNISAVLLPIFQNLYYTAHDLNISPKYFHKFKQIFAISDAVKKDILKKGKFPVTTVPNGIVIEKIDQRNKIQEKSLFRIVQVARLDSNKKGQDILIKAIFLLQQKGITNIQVDFIGTGHSEKELKQLVKDYGIKEQINFLGLQDRKYIYSHLKNYDLMCHPSRYEGFGLTVIEGMAAKLPVLVATGDGPFEVIQQGNYGFYFENENAEDCAKKIEEIITNYSLALKKTDKAYQHVINNYSINQTVQTYLKYYENTIIDQK